MGGNDVVSSVMAPRECSICTGLDIRSIGLDPISCDENLTISGWRQEVVLAVDQLLIGASSLKSAATVNPKEFLPMQTSQAGTGVFRAGALPMWGMLATPFREDLTRIDSASLQRLAAAMAERGCSQLVALGVIAEPASLSQEEKLESLDILLHSTRSPIIASVLDVDYKVARKEAAAFSSEFGHGLSALMVSVSAGEAAELRRRLLGLHAASGLPLVVQDLPRSTGITISAPELLAAIDGLDFIQAIKCESMPTFSRIHQLSQGTSVRLLSGYGGIGLIDDLRAGATGMACGISKPEAIAAALECWRNGDEKRAARVLGEISGLINYETQPGQSIAIRKEHWRRQGVIDHGGVRAPTPPWSSDLEDHSRFYGMV